MTGIIQSLIDVLEQAFLNLQLASPAAVLEDLAVTVHRAMSVEGRHYHTPEHVLSLVSAQNPIQTLAALFHDIVYYQVDRGFSSEVMEIIWPEVGFDASARVELSSVEVAKTDDLFYRLAMKIFDFTAGQKLLLTPGFNEFLSALVMAKKIGSLVPRKTVLQVMVYIEASIPFRGKDEAGHTPFERLVERLREACQDYGITLSEAEIEETICGAVIFANKDVENFAEKAPAYFLDNTWKLLPETNLALRSGGIYSIRDYRLALQKTKAHFSLTIPENVFHTFKGVPPADQYWELVRYARRNIHTARIYLGIKLLAVGILEALAECTGGDAPLSLFMGDARQEGQDARRLGDFLPQPRIHPDIDTRSVIYDLLETGRASHAEFTDLRNSPLSLFIYRTLGPDRVTEEVEHVHAMFDGSLEPEQFLRQIDPTLVSAIARACATMVPTRSEKLNQFVI